MKAPLVIQIENPCHENWDEMTLSAQGKFCSNCQKAVIDFSNKTDAELIEYFNTHSSFCGRFKQSQIDRYIEEPKPVLKKLFHFYSKVAALFFTAFSFKNFQATAQSNQPIIENFVQSADEIHPGKITLEGTITDDEGIFVDSVAIFFDNAKVATSDPMGYYKVDIENVVLKNHVVSFSKNQYRSAVVSFHPLMGNTKLDVTMCNYIGKECYSMGLPARPFVKFNTFQFKLYEKLSEMHAELNEFARKLRENPWSVVAIQMFFTKDSEKKLFEKKGKEIINFLVDNQGIDRERLHIKLVKNFKKKNRIEVIDYREE